MYVNGQAHSNAIESFWSILKGGYHCYVDEFANPYKLRKLDTPDMFKVFTENMQGKRLKYADLIADNRIVMGVM